MSWKNNLQLPRVRHVMAHVIDVLSGWEWNPAFAWNQTSRRKRGFTKVAGRAHPHRQAATLIHVVAPFLPMARLVTVAPSFRAFSSPEDTTMIGAGVIDGCYRASQWRDELRSRKTKATTLRFRGVKYVRDYREWTSQMSCRSQFKTSLSLPPFFQPSDGTRDWPSLHPFPFYEEEEARVDTTFRATMASATTICAGAHRPTTSRQAFTRVVDGRGDTGLAEYMLVNMNSAQRASSSIARVDLPYDADGSLGLVENRLRAPFCVYINPTLSFPEPVASHAFKEPARALNQADTTIIRTPYFMFSRYTK
ncbi:hypothetical protein EDD85DRAFT_941269 [Armillaria nabsnona]|nr:hypothetical protein EDD85DRAFT_941269 [Armillaria nabsnona]